jgi:hypothetical protein
MVAEMVVAVAEEQWWWVEMLVVVAIHNNELALTALMCSYWTHCYCANISC